MRPTSTFLGLCLLSLTTGCAGLTREEAEQAKEELEVSSQAAALTTSGVEIATNFTIGDAAKAAAEELRDFYASQIPCAEVTLKDATLTVEYGKNGDTCTYRGQTYGGKHEISIEGGGDGDGEIVVNHTWTDFHNQTVEVDGTATVTWSAPQGSRHVAYDTSWTRLSDGRMGSGTGDVTHTAMADGIEVGFTADGTREWDGESGRYSMDINAVEMRWRDPVPQAGSYELDIPSDKRVTAEFERVSPTSIMVTLSGPRRSFDFTVTTLP